MKKNLILSLAIATSFASSIPFSANAAPSVANLKEPPIGRTLLRPVTPKKQLPISNLNRTPQPPKPTLTTIPQSAALIVKFTDDVILDTKQRHSTPLVMPLAQDLMDVDGRPIVPAGTPVQMSLKPIKKGAQLIAEALILNGQIIPIKALSPEIPAIKIEKMRTNDKAHENGAVAGKLFGSVSGVFSKGEPEKFDRGVMLGSAIGLVTALIRPNETDWKVQMPRGSVYLLSFPETTTLNLPQPRK
jgi:hypothetical protein